MQTFPKVVLQFSKTWPSKSLKSPWISTFGICRNLLIFGNILFWLLSNTITTFITLQQTKINTSRLIHDRQWRYCVKTIIMAIWQSPKDNFRCAISKAWVHDAMRPVNKVLPWFPNIYNWMRDSKLHFHPHLLPTFSFEAYTKMRYV